MWLRCKKNHSISHSNPIVVLLHGEPLIYSYYLLQIFLSGKSIERGTSNDPVKLRWEAALFHQLAR
jgi:hypothetical protein